MIVCSVLYYILYKMVTKEMVNGKIIWNDKNISPVQVLCIYIYNASIYFSIVDENNNRREIPWNFIITSGQLVLRDKQIPNDFDWNDYFNKKN